MKVPIAVAAPAGALVIRVLGSTWRIQCVGAEHVAAARQVAPGVLFAFWHGRLLPLALTHRHHPSVVLASEHRDGEMLGRTIRYLGIGHVRGSSTRGGTRAILELSRSAHEGLDVGITVDGPRGPRHVVKPGIVDIARRTGSAIVPVTTASKRHKSFASWDAFELPAPFTRVVVWHGCPIVVPPDADRAVLEARRGEVEAALNEITREADRAARE